MIIEDPNELTTISITKGARKLLRDIGRKSETYDDLIKRLVVCHPVATTPCAECCADIDIVSVI